ncbi:EAL domain-containing protein [Colwelliaceae bacterium BS250]
MLGNKHTQVANLKALLMRYKTTKKIQTGLLRLSELTSSVTDLANFYQQLQHVIRRYFPADNLYIQLFTQPNNRMAEYFYVDELNCSPIGQQLNKDLVEFISAIGKPILINHDHVTFRDQQQIVRRPFPIRDDHTKLVNVWLVAPLIIENITIGLVGIKGFISDNKSIVHDLELIQFIAAHISSAILRNRIHEQLQSYNDEIEDVIFARTEHLQKNNIHLRKQAEERRHVEQQLYHAAHHDTLTKLPNRSMFIERLEQSLCHLKRHPNHRFAVLFVDLDRFKVVNDTLGHHVGDQLLIEISNRLADCVRGNDILARLGGDEFVILLDSLGHDDDAEEIALRVIDTINQSFSIDGQEVHTSVSVGITICERSYNSATEILRDADAAMYQAKAMGRGRLVFFDEAMRAELLANLSLEKDLRLAVTNQQFVLHFQKINDLNHTRTIGFEALLRWQHPTRGLLLPADFIAMAEETGLITDIEYWVIEAVSKQLVTWDTQPHFKNYFVSINLSGKHLSHTKSLQQLAKCIENNFAQPQRLVLELNEQALNNNVEVTLKQLTRLKKTGVKLALDNYGSGLSSLAYLNTLPFEFIKFAQSFIHSFNRNEKNLVLAQSLVQLGEQFGFRIVAEGIETQKQLTSAIAAGCEYGQGFFIGKPELYLQDANLTDHEGNGSHCA